MTLIELKKSYASLAKNHSLPAFDAVNSVYNISSLDSSSLSLYSIIKHVRTILEERIQLFENIIQPESTIITVHELSVLSSDDKEHCLKIIKKLMFFYREADLILFNFSDKSATDYINNVVKIDVELKKHGLIIMKKMRDSWKKDFKVSSNDEGYFG